MLANLEPLRNSLNLSLIASWLSLSLYHILPQIPPKKNLEISTKNHKINPKAVPKTPLKINPKTVLQNHKKPPKTTLPKPSKKLS